MGMGDLLFASFGQRKRAPWFGVKQGAHTASKNTAHPRSLLHFLCPVGGVRDRMGRESAPMAFKRSAVRSRLSPPRDLEREFRVFFFFAARPRFQRFHDSTVGNGLHENAFRAFRGIVGIRGTVISLESLETWDDAPSDLHGQAVFAVGVVVAAAGQEGFDQPEGERLPFFQRVAGRAAPTIPATFRHSA